MSQIHQNLLFHPVLMQLANELRKLYCNILFGAVFYNRTGEKRPVVKNRLDNYVKMRDQKMHDEDRFNEFF